MKLRTPLLMIASLLLLLAGLTLPLAAQAGPKKPPGDDGPAASAPDCGKGQPECYVDVTYNPGSLTACPSFEDSRDGSCVGSATGSSSFTNPGYFPRQGIQTEFGWKGQGAHRDVEIIANATFTILDSKIVGDVASPNSAVFNISDAWSRPVADVHYKTVSKGGNPGQPNGPLYIDFEHKTIGSYIHVYGYLVRK